jgi:hypothetical protein
MDLLDDDDDLDFFVLDDVPASVGASSSPSSSSSLSSLSADRVIPATGFS